MAHAKRSPSGSAGWLECAGWTSDSTGSAHANEGSDAHELAAICLDHGTNAADYIGHAMEYGTVVSSDMAEPVQRYVQYVRDVVAATGGTLLIEQRLPIAHVTGETDAHGTADAVVLAGTELIVIDLKFGRGVAVEAERNSQLMIYALGALATFGLAQDFTQVRLVIHQPRLQSVTEWTISVEDLQRWHEWVAARVLWLDANPDQRNPGDKQCRWCASKATCPALAHHVQAVTGMDFEDVTEPVVPTDANDLAHAMANADLIEQWLKAVRAETERRLLAGAPVPGFKLVQGKRGNRRWANDAEAEQVLKGMRVKDHLMYDYRLISPTRAEALAKSGDIGPRQWPKVQALITQSEGQPSVAPESDKRPALVVTAAADDFDNVTDLA